MNLSFLTAAQAGGTMSMISTFGQSGSHYPDLLFLYAQTSAEAG